MIDPSIATTARGIWAIKWSFVILATTSLMQLGIVALSGSVALLADTIHNIGDAGTAIPLGSRIVSACDAWDAMITTRPYRKALSVADALAEIRRCAGTQFDPDVVVALCAEVEATFSGLPQAAAA